MKAASQFRALATAGDVVWCDGLTNQYTTNSPHANFTLAPGAGSVALSRVISPGVPQIVDYLNYTNLPANWSYGDFPDNQPFYRQPMFAATPGAFNTNTSPPISIVINEWMADNSLTLANPVGGKFDDWFELYNYGTNTVDLGGYYLTGTLTNNEMKFRKISVAGMSWLHDFDIPKDSEPLLLRKRRRNGKDPAQRSALREQAIARYGFQ